MPTHSLPSPIIGVHLDLKGTVFKPSYIPQLMADLASQGVNAVLVEYEDVFPFEGIFPETRPEVWDRRTLAKFNAEAKKNGIEVIPLQQCMGHLEYLLCWKRYRKLAENQKYPSTIRVDDDKAVALITNMLVQVIEGHPESQIIHLGMDEAWALHDTAKRTGKSVLDLYLDHLRILIPIVERAGKTPYIWTDMLEDHFDPKAFDDFRGRVIFGTWDYQTRAGDYLPWARLSGGTRVSKQWLDEPWDKEAPPIAAGTKFVEDYTPAIKKALEPHRKGRYYRRNFHVDLWSELGMQCLPVSALRVSSNLSVLPPYNDLMVNVRGWSDAVKRTKQMGQIGTSWARGTSWCPPNYSIDLQWPMIAEMGRTMGAKVKPFFAGVPEKTVRRVYGTLGRCRHEWRLEGKIADEMEALLPKVKSHRFEWQSTILMARTLDLQRRAQYNIDEVEFFNANNKPVDSEWQRRLDEQKQTLADIDALRKKVVAHFGKRYHGDAFEEWVSHLFDIYVKKIKFYAADCRKKLAVARRVYAK
jgi:hypothetical protein